MAINFNADPYFDDYDENKNFYRVLFRPGYAVQARELTQLQTILQKQIARHGNHIFKEGAMVIPGQMSIDTNASYVKLQPTYNSASISSNINFLEGQVVVGQTSGVTALVVKVEAATSTDPHTIFVKYTNSGSDNTTKVFDNNETLSTESGSVYSVQTLASDATGTGSIATIERGVYYIKDTFALVFNQTIVLDKYTNTPSYRIGLDVQESFVDSETDESLLDNATGSYNFAAPGAARYNIELVLTKLALDSTNDQDFITLAVVNNGKVEQQVRSTDYSVLEENLARRTYDESGNYTVTPFEIDVREHRNNDRGAWTVNTAYLIGDVVTNNGNTYVAKNSGTSVTGSPTHTTGNAYDGPGSTGISWQYNQSPVYNRGVYVDGDESKLAIGLEPGKAYVRGYEIQKIATEYVEIDKARDFVQTDNAVIPTTVGNYVLVTNVNNIPKADTFETISLYHSITGSAGRGAAVGTKIGTARVRGIEWHNGTIGSDSAIYKLFLFDVKLDAGYDFNRDVKSFYFDGGSTSSSFSADISPIATQLIGSISQTLSAVTGSGTSFQTDLKVGDYVYLGSTLAKVLTITSQQDMTVDTSETLTGVTYGIATTQIIETENTSLVFRLPYYAIKAVRSALGTNDTIYAVMQRFTGTTSGATGGTCTLTVSTSAGTMASAAETDNYMLVDNTTGSVVAPNSISVSGSSVTFTLNSSYASRAFVVVGTVNKSGATGTEKIKTLNTATVTFTTKQAATSQALSLGKADCYRVLSVKMKSGTFDSSGTDYDMDIMDRYTFDDGQRSTHYDVGSLQLKASYSAPTAPVEVVFEYFTHSPGDYFTVNSYPATVAYKEIPSFGLTPLRDVIDFRPRIGDDGLSFSNSGASLSLVPKRGIDVTTDFTYYLPRKDKIAVDFNGKFFNIAGVPSLNPGEPLDPSLGMVLYKLDLEPYTFGASAGNVNVNKLDNKRYTMRDIGKLEKRIDNLEYYTSLSLLEQETNSLNIADADGLNRFKNGFIVDNFTGHNVGDVTSADYLCAVDMEAGELRPFYTMDNVNLIEKNSNNGQRSASNYKLYGDVITLPVIDEIVLAKQEYASRTEFVNPFAIFTFIGDVQLNPSTDDWFEVNRRPDIVQNVEGNFNTVATLAEKSGVLGTVWNAWQTQWTGTTVSSGLKHYTTGSNWANQRALSQGYTYIDTNQANELFGGAGGGGPARQIVADVSATTVGQSRTGIKTSVVAKIDTRVVDDKVLSSAVIPYIRSRNLLIQVKKLKPLTKFYPYFDDVSIAQYCTQASKLVYTPGTGVFDFNTNVGGLSTEVARRISGDSQVCLNKGDVITGSVSGATAVVVGAEYDIDTDQYALQILNINGTFSANETIVGSITSATATVVSTTIKTVNDDLITNNNGEIVLLFDIPNNDSARFRTGSREFKLVDVSTATADFTSRARSTYNARGVLETRQANVIATRNAEIATEVLNQNQVVVQTSARVVSDTGWYDPLAQTFLVQSKGGAFLSKVDIFFAKKDTKVPVTLEIREVINGYPGKLVLPFSRVTLNPEQVNMSSTNVTVDDVAYPKYDTPTSFTFPSPVYVQDNNEYCIVLSSDSNNYKVWIAQMGDTIPDSNRTISEQPYAGVFFKSQNASTWTAEQNQDLKFTIWRNQFDTSVVSDVEFVNDMLPYADLETDPFQTKVGFNKVRVWHSNHGMTVGSTVTISNNDDTKVYGSIGTGTIAASSTSNSVSGTGTTFTSNISAGTVIYSSNNTYIGVVSSVLSDNSLTLVSNAATTVNSGSAYKFVDAINGIPATEIYTTTTISDVDPDSYCITTSNATVTGYAGGFTVKATKNVQFDSVQPNVQIQTFSDTVVASGLKTTSGKSADGTQTPYVLDNDFGGVLINENNQFYTPRMIASEINENTLLGGQKSVSLAIQMQSVNDALSPIIDTHRTSLIAVSNKINHATEVNTNIATLDTSVLFTGANGAYSFAGSTITSTNLAVMGLMNTIIIGKYITISGATSSANNGTYLVTGLVDTGTSLTVSLAGVTFVSESATAATTVTIKDMFIDDITPVDSTNISNYVSKQIKLKNPSSFLRVRFSANVPTESDILVYYKTLPVGAINNLNEIAWTLSNPDSTIVKGEVGDESFYDIDYSEDNITPFDVVLVKLVMKSTNSSAIPRVKDLRIIACA